MNILQSVIGSMTREEARFYKLFSSRSHDKVNRLDEQLFDYIRQSGEEYDEELIYKKLYKRKDKNSFYRLKHRLLQDLAKSLTLQHFEEDDTIYSLHLLALVKFHFGRNNMKAAHYYLKKAEAEARRTENYELLDMIYSDFIRLSHENITVNPEEYIQLRRDNQQKIRQLRGIDDILAAVSYRMKITQNYSAGENPVLPMLQQIVSSYSSDKELIRSPKLRFRLYHAVSQILLQKRDYYSLEAYLLSAWKEFEEEKLFNRTNHDTKLQMLVFIVNTLFKNGKLKESLRYAELLHKALEEFQRLHYDKYLFFYYNALVINYSRLDREKAVEILNEMKSNEKIRSIPFYEMFVYLNLAVVHFDRGDYHTSIRNLNRVYLLDGYKSADPSLQFKIGVAELLIRYELHDEEIVEMKIRQLKKDFREFFRSKDLPRELLMVDVIGRLVQGAVPGKDKALSKKMMELLEAETVSDSSDAEIINYAGWLNTRFSEVQRRK